MAIVLRLSPSGGGLLLALPRGFPHALVLAWRGHVPELLLRLEGGVPLSICLVVSVLEGAEVGRS